MNKSTVTWLAVVLLVAAAGAGTWLWQRRQNDDQVNRLQQRVEELQTQATNLAESLNAPSGESSGDRTVNAPVVFDPPGNFNAAAQEQVQTSVLAPHEHYQSDQGERVAAYYVTEASGGQYAITAIFSEQDNAYDAFLIDVSGETGLTWTPMCLEQCNFSSDFAQQYPEIVERAQ